LNIGRDTATSAIWNATWRQSLRPGADLDQFLAQTGQRPLLDPLGHRQGSHEVAKVVGESMELKAGGVCGEGAARQPRPFDRALTFLDPLLRRSALVVEGVDGLGWTHQVGDDEADLRIKLACIPLDFRHNSAHHSDVTVSG
jgi:hypothetical protein